jgi:phytoene dehydrogenase-like protein
MTHSCCDVAVVGGGLGGLAVAALLGRRGLDVLLVERASALGGRATTHVRDGFFFNQGAHALYLGGAAARVLGQLGVRWAGRRPPPTGRAWFGDRGYALPATAGAMLTTGLLSLSGKVQGARLLARLGSLDADALAGTPLDAWLTENVPDSTMRATFESFVRVSTYTHAPALLSAGAAIRQLRLAQRPGVSYLDAGWQTLVSDLAGVAAQAGVRVRTGARASQADRDATGGWRVHVGEGDPIACRALVLATSPATARSIVASRALSDWESRAVPVQAACLDVGVARLPDMETTFALGVDRPLYFSVHSRTARVAPPGAALVSAMKYLSPLEQPDPARDEAELEVWLDRLQPGWRDAMVERRWLPAMVVSHALVTASGGGLAGRPGPVVPDAPGVVVVGDWVGAEGMLLDASIASAERAAEEVGRMLAVAKVA